MARCECAKCPRGCSQIYEWLSPQMSEGLWICSYCAHKLNDAGEVIERKGRIMRRAPSVETA